jgi:hypothetical protein
VRGVEAVEVVEERLVQEGLAPADGAGETRVERSEDVHEVHG